MKSLDAWLTEKHGRAAELAQALAVTRSALSQVRNGDRPMPTNWIPVVAEFSNGVLSIESLVREASGHAHQERVAKRQGH